MDSRWTNRRRTRRYLHVHLDLPLPEFEAVLAAVILTVFVLVLARVVTG